VAIDDDAGTTVAETHAVKPALMAELTWAKLYKGNAQGSRRDFYGYS
jgi:hypothetical protein